MQLSDDGALYSKATIYHCYCEACATTRLQTIGREHKPTTGGVEPQMRVYDIIAGGLLGRNRNYGRASVRGNISGQQYRSAAKKIGTVQVERLLNMMRDIQGVTRFTHRSVVWLGCLVKWSTWYGQAVWARSMEVEAGTGVVGSMNDMNLSFMSKIIFYRYRVVQ